MNRNRIIHLSFKLTTQIGGMGRECGKQPTPSEGLVDEREMDKIGRTYGPDGEGAGKTTILF
jgi:hypothetical protein